MLPQTRLRPDRPLSNRRRALRAACANGGLWALGNGLVSTQLVIFLANEYGVKGIGISFILAAPRLAGLVRLATPALVAFVRHRKALCIGAFVASSLVLSTVPGVQVINQRAGNHWAVSTLVLAWSLYHLLEYAGTVALWSWLGDLTPRRIRGRLLGKRERWLVLGRIGGIAVSALLTLAWSHLLPESPRWHPLSLSAAVGAAVMALAAASLAFMPAASEAPSALPRQPGRTLIQAVCDRPYRRLITFSFCFALASGWTLSAQQVYPIRVLELSYPTMILLSALMWAGQSALAPFAGRLTDHLGSRPVMIVSLLVASTGLLFFLAATPQAPWLIAGAYLAWVAYAGLNVGLDKMKLQLAAPDNNAPYVAVYHTLSDLANAVAILLGGLLYDRLAGGGSDALRLFSQLFLWGWLARTSTVLLLARLVDPSAPR